MNATLNFINDNIIVKTERQELFLSKSDLKKRYYKIDKEDVHIEIMELSDCEIDNIDRICIDIVLYLTTKHLPIRSDVKEVTYHRQPTAWEIKFGEGAIHWLTVDVATVTKKNGELKKWFINPYDGLRYNY